MLRTYSFDEAADKDILEHLDRLAESGKASQFVRDAIRAAMNKNENKDETLLTTILEEIREIKRNGVVVSGNGEVKRGEPEDIAANLDALGL